MPVESSSSTGDYSIGDRVAASDGSEATVRYIGPIAIAKSDSEIWIGVEWDSPGRGKHDGSCTDKSGSFYRYFTCENGRGKNQNKFAILILSKKKKNFVIM